MLKSDLAQTDEHSTNDLLQPKNLRFSSRTNIIKSRCQQKLKKVQFWRNKHKFDFPEI